MTTEKQNIMNRLKRIEGQLKGIQRMLDNEACCVDVLIQIAAVKAAVNKVGTLIFENHAKECLTSSEDTRPKDEVIEDLMKVLISFIK
ncbi:DNA-binding transcriptional regulator, FrmR family [Desulfonispora thiosulfatigenes DSM 11270]|uniref:DNA-binding transcriptional regulator, FrmR family n=1 Tax=Desulfonispora thiosulfatigenes DSM 11270 TaxID=656914 RepID=A0A1W1VQV7_DESTI|nr:metal-sensitive transcriptional regulator [Desulfonispora thiosulfatigenes]SMB95653.1 DNA-binding transcriptional regulator, FrmR family [Desulfonispora thiosulfatigenes DSM 11270]